MGENVTSYLKMATVQEKAMYILWFFETKSVIKISFVTEPNMGKIRLHIMLSDVGLSNFKETGNVLRRKEAGRRSTWQADVDRI
jgi:hypothetical protein